MKLTSLASMSPKRANAAANRKIDAAAKLIQKAMETLDDAECILSAGGHDTFSVNRVKVSLIRPISELGQS
jgi:hypothetical protein